MVTRLLLALDSSAESNALRGELRQDDEIYVVEEVSTVDDLCAAVRRSLPDVLLIDRMQTGVDGIAAAAEIRRVAGTRAPAIVILAAPQQVRDVVPAARAGVRGYLVKGPESRALRAAVRSVGAGAAWLSPSAAGALLDALTAPSPWRPLPGRIPLTDRERSIVRLIARGYSNAEVARELSLSESTVKTHVSRVLAKLELRSRTQLAVLARDHGIV